ncbi:hypothetical protein HNY73_013213 [Argiope bruennichi]|uniref:Uncharacterized protein n=1 Tax=Argiope bruennichi TaxID=94029 RepID=A0A8T0F386_ARGBR|nr:hypothetical protein HNY73_013213 [Argiope bruennichi]
MVSGNLIKGRGDVPVKGCFLQPRDGLSVLSGFRGGVATAQKLEEYCRLEWCHRRGIVTIPHGPPDPHVCGGLISFVDLPIINAKEHEHAKDLVTIYVERMYTAISNPARLSIHRNIELSGEGRGGPSKRRKGNSKALTVERYGRRVGGYVITHISVVSELRGLEEGPPTTLCRCVHSGISRGRAAFGETCWRLIVGHQYAIDPRHQDLCVSNFR